MNRELTPAEHQAVLLLARGYTFEAIARELGISVKAVGGRLDRAKIRLRAGTLAELVTRWIAMRAGIPADTFYRSLARGLPPIETPRGVDRELTAAG